MQKRLCAYQLESMAELRLQFWTKWNSRYRYNFILSSRFQGSLRETLLEAYVLYEMVPVKVRKRAILSRPGGDGRACPSLKSLEQKRDCSSRCQKPKLKFGPWSACKTGKSRYPSTTCPGIQNRKIVCSTSDDSEFPIHKCLSPGQSLPMSRTGIKLLLDSA